MPCKEALLRVTRILLAAILSGIYVLPAQASGSSPEMTVGCYDSYSTGSDYAGRYIEYVPTVSAKFNGKKASIQTFVNDELVNTLKITRTYSTYSKREYFDIKVRFYKDSSSIGRNEYKLIFKDSKNRRTIWICKVDLYESSFGLGSSSGSSGGFGSGIYSCQLNGKKLYGSVYIANSSYLADFSVYVTSSSYLADLKVYQTSSSYLANSCGIWYITTSPYLADFSVYLTSSSYLADFTIYLTSSSYLAGT